MSIAALKCDSNESYVLPARWQGTHVINTRTFQQLIDNEIPFIKVQNFFNEEQCRLFSSMIAQLQGYEGSSDLYKIGPSIHEYEGNVLTSDYALKTSHAFRLSSMFETLRINPLSSVLSLLKHTPYKATFATHQGQPLFAGVIRNTSLPSLLHADFAPLDSTWVDSSSITHQLAWVLTLKTAEGNRYTVYNRPWSRFDEALRFSDSYHFSNDVVRGKESASVTLTSGDLLFYNSRNFHEVSETSTPRLTCSSFMGLNMNQRYPVLELWS